MEKIGDKSTLHIGFASFSFLSDWSGVERVTADLAAAMLERGHRVTIIARAGGKPAKTVPVIPLPEGCCVLKLELDSRDGIARARDDFKAADLDVTVSMFGGRDLLWIPWLLNESGIPLVSAECIDPGVMTRERWNPYEHYGALMAADRIQVLLRSYREQYPKTLQNRIDVIGNPSPSSADVDWRARADKKGRVLLGLGRFEESQKQFSLLLRAWALLAPEFPEWSLELVGDGPQWELYRAMAETMGKNSRVAFTGSVTDTSPRYAAADLFCMPSRYEGFPMVLIEAAAHGLPLVGFRSCPAAREVIAPGTGALAEEDNPASLADALRPLMAMPPEIREAIGREARRALGEICERSVIFGLWEDTLLRAAQCKGDTQLDRLARERWDEALLGQAALEIVSRDHPLVTHSEEENMENAKKMPAAAIARLMSGKDALERDHRLLQKKYDALLAQYRATAARRKK